MNRKQFVRSVLPAGLGLLIAGNGRAADDPHSPPIPTTIPPYLKPGDTIAITCPASPLEEGEAENCIQALRSWGYRVKLGHTIGDNWERFSGTDEERLADFQEYLDSDDVDAIIFGRGGYGVMRIMDRINWDKFAKKPKWLVGYSDITALHCHINSVFHIATIHADMANGFNGLGDRAELSIRDVLAGEPINYSFNGYAENRPGQVTGELVGGNLSLIYAMQGSKSEINTENKILLIEDVSEYKYTIDRMMLNLKRSGKLDKLAALAVGSFTSMKEEKDASFSMALEDIILEKVKEYDYPVCFHFPSGHQRMNLAFKLGLRYQFSIGDGFCHITELPTGSPELMPPLATGDSLGKMAMKSIPNSNQLVPF